MNRPLILSPPVSDLMRVAREIRSGSPERVSPFAHARLGEYLPISIALHRSAYYLRFRVRDQPGIIAALASALAAEKISIEAVLQLPEANASDLPFVITVEPASEQSIRAALARMEKLNFLIEPPRCRVFDNTGVVMTNATATLMTYDSEGFDTDTMHSTVSNTSRVVFTTAGTYLVIVSLYFPSFTYTLLDWQCRLNAAGSSAGGTQLVNVSFMDNINRLTYFTFMRFFSAADYIENFYTQTSGANRTTGTLDLRSADMGRTFTIVFFTDGCPTIGETNTDRILKNVTAKNSSNTRIFTFGVGEADGLNATFLDQLAEQTRAVSSFVRPAEDIEVKVSGLFSKISHPVLANLKLEAGNDIRLLEVYPPQLPDLFHGGQLVVMGRFAGKGPAALKLTGSVGQEYREFVYETTFPEKTNDEKSWRLHVLV